MARKAAPLPSRKCSSHLLKCSLLAALGIRPGAADTLEEAVEFISEQEALAGVPWAVDTAVPFFWEVDVSRELTELQDDSLLIQELIMQPSVVFMVRDSSLSGPSAAWFVFCEEFGTSDADSDILHALRFPETSTMLIRRLTTGDTTYSLCAIPVKSYSIKNK